MLRPRSPATRIPKQVALAISGAGAIAVIVLTRPTALDLVLCIGLYVATLIGVTLGYHRMLSHGAFEAHPIVKHALFALGGMALQGPPSVFAAYHVHHHATSDTADDRQSPRRGWWYAHVTWFCYWEPDDRARERFRRDPIVRFYDRNDIRVGLAGFAFAALLGGAIGRSWHAALGGLLWGGGVRLFAAHHALWLLGWACHAFGRSEFETRDGSRNNWWAGLLVLGDGLHNNHHALPSAANCNAHWWQLDPLAWLIAGLERLGFVHDVRWARREHWAKRRRRARPVPDPTKMIARSAGERVGAVVVVALPVVVFAVALARGWLGQVSGLDLALFTAFYAFTMLGLTLGYHRLLAHEAFVAHPVLEAILLALAGMAVQGAPSSFAATHRLHHARADRPGDPHSPKAGFWHAHIGWFVAARRVDTAGSRARLRKDPIVRWFDDTQLVWALAGLVLPFGLGWLLGGGLGTAMTALLWGGVLRLGASQHVVWAFASLDHVIGTRAFATLDDSRNSFVLNLVQLGDGWHNNHHAIPGSANFSERWWQLDLGAIVLRGCERVGLARDVNWVSRERWAARRQRLAGLTISHAPDPPVNAEADQPRRLEVAA